MSKVHDGYESLLGSKREELLEYVRQCLEEIHTTADENITVRDEVHKADKFYSEQKLRIAECESLALLDGMIPPMLKEKDKFVNKIETVLHPTPSVKTDKPGGNSLKNNDNDDTQYDKPETKKKYKMLNRSIAFPARRLETEEEVNAYVKDMKDKLMQYLKSFDGIDIN